MWRGQARLLEVYCWRREEMMVDEVVARGNNDKTYCISRRILLLRSNNAAASLGLVQRRFAADDCFFLAAAWASCFGADFGDLVPVGHFAFSLDLLRRWRFGVVVRWSGEDG